MTAHLPILIKVNRVEPVVNFLQTERLEFMIISLEAAGWHGQGHGRRGRKKVRRKHPTPRRANAESLTSSQDLLYCTYQLTLVYT